MPLKLITQGLTQQSQIQETTSKEVRATLHKEIKEKVEKIVKDILEENNRKIKQQIKADIGNTIKENNRNQESQIMEPKTMLQALTHHFNVLINSQGNHNPTSSNQSANARAGEE
eukprot:11087585-Ditylum_brightwellii.AAC.1